MRRRLKRGIAVLAGIALAYALLLAWVWNGRSEILLNSTALGENRSITVFGNITATTIYSLDGDKYRHGLLPAAHGALVAWALGQPRPMLVAIHDHGARNKDFRPAKINPASWRPDISGHAPAFDAFLLVEVRGEIERRFGLPNRRFLFGHSLGGFYALDMPTRQPAHGFAGLYAFSPTFSHDLSLVERLAATCAHSDHIYVNIGIESRRDTDVFDAAERAASRLSNCSKKLRFFRHYGMVHQVIMLSGQIAAFARIFGNSDT